MVTRIVVFFLVYLILVRLCFATKGFPPSSMVQALGDCFRPFSLVAELRAWTVPYFHVSGVLVPETSVLFFFTIFGASCRRAGSVRSFLSLSIIFSVGPSLLGVFSPRKPFYIGSFSLCCIYPLLASRLPPALIPLERLHPNLAASLLLSASFFFLRSKDEQ